MRVNGISGGMRPQKTQRTSSGDRASIARRLEQLKKQMQQVKENKRLSPEEKEKKLSELQKQIDDLQKQQAKAEQAEKRQETADVQTEKAQALEQVTKANQPRTAKELSMEMKRRFDTFEHQEEGETAGLYAVEKGADGARAVRFDGTPEDTKAADDPSKPEEEEPTVVVTTMDLSEVERDIKQLRQRQQQLEQTLGTAPEEQQEALQRELQRVTQELARKDTDAYRNSHDHKRQYTLF